MMRCQWYQLDHMQIICTLRQTDDHATTPFFTGRMPFLPPNQQQHQSIEGTILEISHKSSTIKYPVYLLTLHTVMVYLQTVTHLNTNQAQHGVTLLVCTLLLPLGQTITRCSMWIVEFCS